MSTISLRCDSCGSNLTINPNINYCTCAHCGSSLQLQHTGNAYYTKVLDRVEQNTQKALQNSEILLIEQRIERLDREWALTKESYVIKGKYGKTTMPSTSSSLVGVALFVIFGVIMFMKFGGLEHFNPLLFIGVLVVGFLSIFSSFLKANKYEQVKKSYEQKRQQLLEELRRCS